MKIMMISGSFPPIECGVGDYSAWVAEALADRGHDVQVITSSSAAKTALTKPIIPTWNLTALPIILNEINRQRPNVIHIQYPTKPYGRKIAINLLPLILRLRFPRIPVIVTAHEYHDASRLGKLRIIGTLLFASKIIITNHESLQSLKRVLPFRPHTLIPIASNIPLAKVSEVHLKELRKKYELDNHYILSYFGFIDPSKGIDHLLNAIEGMPQSIKILLVTAYDKTNPYHQSLRARIDALDGRVVWTGYISAEDVSALLQLSDGCIFPFDAPASLRRSSLITALVHGLPTITTGPVSAPLISGENCLATQGNSSDELAKAILELSASPELGRMMKVNVALLGKTFDRGEITTQHEKVYSSLVS